MKKLVHINNFILSLILILMMTSCVPSANKVKDKMIKEGYVTIDPTYLVTHIDENVKKLYLFVKAENATEAIKKLNNTDTDKILVYYFYNEASCNSFYLDTKNEYDYLFELAKKQYEQNIIDKTTYEQTLKDLNNQDMGKSDVCFYMGTKQAIKDFK